MCRADRRPEPQKQEEVSVWDLTSVLQYVRERLEGDGAECVCRERERGGRARMRELWPVRKASETLEAA